LPLPEKLIAIMNCMIGLLAQALVNGRWIPGVNRHRGRHFCAVPDVNGGRIDRAPAAGAN
jgi:hypothetical protein